ncbi:MAG TPA: hypothetical protein VMV77_00760 [Bacteroidales bacterium]|nr:hypothetical protein [Bacteroidales bacterium]
MYEYYPEIESLVLKVKTRQMIADEYGTTEKTLIRRLLKKGVVLPLGHIFPNTCKIIYYTLGIPATLKTNINNGQKQ